MLVLFLFYQDKKKQNQDANPNTASPPYSWILHLQAHLPNLLGIPESVLAEIF
jgi:hypothetical protein